MNVITWRRRFAWVVALPVGVLLTLLTPDVALADSFAGSRGAQDAVEGSFRAVIESEPVVRDLPDGRCKLKVTGRLVFEGTLVGEALGTTTARIQSPCSELDLAHPDFRDVFRFKGTFTGTVAGEEVRVPLTYAGVTSPGGTIEALIRLRTTPRLVLHTEDAVVAVGGRYTTASRC